MKLPTKIIDQFGEHRWLLDGIPHRVDGPAIIYKDGSQVWFVNGKYHRIDGPAVTRADGSQEWYVNGKHITDKHDLSFFDTEEGRMILIIKYGC